MISELLTIKLESEVQLSLIINPNDSNSATVVAASGVIFLEQPSILVVAIVPIMVGAVVS